MEEEPAYEVPEEPLAIATFWLLAILVCSALLLLVAMLLVLFLWYCYSYLNLSLDNTDPADDFTFSLLLLESLLPVLMGTTAFLKIRVTIGYWIVRDRALLSTTRRYTLILVLLSILFFWRLFAPVGWPS